MGAGCLWGRHCRSSELGSWLLWPDGPAGPGHCGSDTVSTLARAGQGSRAASGPCPHWASLSLHLPDNRPGGPCHSELLRRRPHPQHSRHRASHGGHQSSPSSATLAPGGWQPSSPRVLDPGGCSLSLRCPFCLTARPSPLALPAPHRRTSGTKWETTSSIMPDDGGKTTGPPAHTTGARHPHSPREPSVPLGRPGPEGEPLHDCRWTGSSVQSSRKRVRVLKGCLRTFTCLLS